MSDPNETRTQFIKRMDCEGYRCDTPGDNELFIDLDSHEAYLRFETLLGYLQRNYSNAEFERTETPSKSGLPNRHIRMVLPYEVVGDKVITDAERIAWQGALGSDQARELLSMIRLFNGDLPCTLFAEKKPDVDMSGLEDIL